MVKDLKDKNQHLFILQVSLAPRDICSRMNTFMVETEKAATREDKESLVVVRVSRWDIVVSMKYPRMTILFAYNREKTKRRHLLSADSRVERLTWCDMLTRFVIR